MIFYRFVPSWHIVFMPLFLLLALCMVTWHCAGDEESNTKLLPAQRWVLPTVSLLVGSLVLVYVMVLAKHGTG